MNMNKRKKAEEDEDAPEVEGDAAIFIPGLMRYAYRNCGAMEADTPDLMSAKVNNDGSFCFEWHATGSALYIVTASGRIELSWQLGDTATIAVPVFKGWSVKCSCPSGIKMPACQEDEGSKRVCKHAAAALDSVCSKAAHAEVTRQKTLQVPILAAAAAGAATFKDAAHAKQEAEMPGERARIAHGLQQLSPSRVVAMIHEAIDTVEGLRHAAALFDASKITQPAELLCVRCGLVYDFKYPSTCEIEHPSSYTHWEGSNRSWERCNKCHKDFNVEGFSRRERGAPDVMGPYCFKGAHTTDKALVDVWETSVKEYGDDY